MKILIYGAGVIGSLYTILLNKAGYNVYIYARGKRLETLKSKGLLYLEKGKEVQMWVKVINHLDPLEHYDFIFLTVRENQLYQALEELKENNSDIVTFVNSIDDYHYWEKICGKGRIIPAFPGAGGSIHDDLLDAGLTPSFIQSTTFGEISGYKSNRTEQLSKVFKKAKIPYQIVTDMHLWQLCHLAMVVPIADAYYMTSHPDKAGSDVHLMYKTASSIKHNLKCIKRMNGKVSPFKMYLLIYLPKSLITIGLIFIYKSAFGHKFMYEHAMKAPDEMRELHKQLYEYIQY